MQKTYKTFIQQIIEKCDELEASITEYCDGRTCYDCDFKGDKDSCRYKTNLLMLLNGYRMGTCNEDEKHAIWTYLTSNYPTFLIELT